jgi:hypothetical protein
MKNQFDNYDKNDCKFFINDECNVYKKNLFNYKFIFKKEYECDDECECGIINKFLIKDEYDEYVDKYKDKYKNEEYKNDKFKIVILLCNKIDNCNVEYDKYNILKGQLLSNLYNKYKLPNNIKNNFNCEMLMDSKYEITKELGISDRKYILTYFYKIKRSKMAGHIKLLLQNCADESKNSHKQIKIFTEIFDYVYYNKILNIIDNNKFLLVVQNKLIGFYNKDHLPNEFKYYVKNMYAKFGWGNIPIMNME